MPAALEEVSLPIVRVTTFTPCGAVNALHGRRAEMDLPRIPELKGRTALLTWLVALVLGINRDLERDTQQRGRCPDIDLNLVDRATRRALGIDNQLVGRFASDVRRGCRSSPKCSGSGGSEGSMRAGRE